MLVAQSCLALCNSLDCSLPDSSVHGILQARILGWVAVSFSRGIFLTQGSNRSLLHGKQIFLPSELPAKPLSPWRDGPQRIDTGEGNWVWG